MDGMIRLQVQSEWIDCRVTFDSELPVALISGNFVTLEPCVLCCWSGFVDLGHGRKIVRH